MSVSCWPTTLALAGVLGALLCYGWHLRVTSGSAGGDPLGRGGPVLWAVLGGLSMGVSLMAVGLFGLVAVPVVATILTAVKMLYVNDVMGDEMPTGTGVT